MIAIVKYNAGNIRSVENALNRLGCDFVITDSEELLRSASKVIFPGVGEAKSAMKYLVERNLHNTLIYLTQPVLGICLGLQLMCKFSEEGNTNCLGIFDVLVKKFPPDAPVPHMGWNNVCNSSGSLFANLDNSEHFYFVHSYYAELNKHTVAACNYILPFSAALQRDNFFATQFHPEKSADAGEKVLKNFLEL